MSVYSITRVMDECPTAASSDFLERAEKRKDIQYTAACPIVAMKEANLVTARPLFLSFFFSLSLSVPGYICTVPLDTDGSNTDKKIRGELPSRKKRRR